MPLPEKISTIAGFFADRGERPPADEEIHAALLAVDGDMTLAVAALRRETRDDTAAIIEDVARQRDAQDRRADVSVAVATTWDKGAPDPVRGAILVAVPPGARRVLQILVSRQVAAVLPHATVAFLARDWRAIGGEVVTAVHGDGGWVEMRGLTPVPAVPAEAAFLALRGVDILAVGGATRTKDGFTAMRGVGVSVAFECGSKI